MLNRVSAASLDLDKWLDMLPDSIRITAQMTRFPPAHVIVLHVYYHFMVLTLYRPYYLRQTSTVDLSITKTAVRRCNSAA
jgi:hypothetical protein